MLFKNGLDIHFAMFRDLVFKKTSKKKFSHAITIENKTILPRSN